MSSVITFYDIPLGGQPARPWSPNTWKVRYVIKIHFNPALNYKRIPYKTVWVEYPDIEHLCKKLSVGPTGKRDDGITDRYTLPMIYDPSTDRVVTDSIPIMRYLDDTYPDTPPLFPKGTEALHVAFSKYGWVFLGYHVFHIVLEKITASLNPIIEKFLRAEREAHFKRPLAETNTPEQWKLFEEGVGKLKYFLAANGEGKDTLFSGSSDPKTISYSDVLIAAILIWPRIVFRPESEEWRRISWFHGGFVATFMKRFLDYEYVDVGEALVNHS